MATPTSRHGHQDDTLFLKKFINLCLKKWWWFLISVVIVCGLGGSYLLLKSPTYTVTANVLITNSDTEGGSAALLMKQFDFATLLGGTGSVDNEIAIMSSHSVMLKTVKDLALNCKYIVKDGLIKKIEPWDKTPIKLSFNPEICDTLGNTIIFKIKARENGKVNVTLKKGFKTLAELEDASMPAVFDTPYGQFTLSPTEYFNKYFEDDDQLRMNAWLSSYSATAEGYQKSILIAQLNKKVDLVSLSFQSTNPEYAKKIINTVIANYNVAGIQQQRQKGERTLGFLNDRIAILSEQLESQEIGLEKYKKEHNLSDVQANASLAIGRSANLQDALVAAESDYEIMKLVKTFITNPENKYSLIPSVGENIGGGVQDGINNYNNKIMSRMQLLTNAKVDNAVVKNLTDVIDAMRGNINLTLDKALETAYARLQDLRQETSKARSLELTLPTREREYLDIARNREIQEKLYLYMLQQREEKSMSIANIMPSAEIIDEVYVLSESGLTPKLAILILFILGLCIPAGYIFLKERMRRNIDSEDEVGLYSSLPVIGAAPHLTDGNYVVDADWSRVMQANTGYILGSCEGKVAMVTAMGHEEGKSLIAANIATEFAKQGHHTILIETDMSKHDATELFGIKAKHGLADYLGGNTPLNDVISCVPTSGNLNIIPACAAGITVPNATTLLKSPRFTALIDQLRDTYDYIIIDAPSINGAGDLTAVIASHTDATLIVIRQDVTAISDVENIARATQSGIYKTISLIYNDKA